MTENEFLSHFSPFQINTQLLIFLHFFFTFQINTQLDFFSQNGCRRPFWMTENFFWLYFWPFQINTQLLFIYSCSQNGCRRPYWMDENHFRSHFSPFQINTQLFFFDFCSQNNCRRPFWMAENHFRSHFRAIGNFFFTKWLPAAILDCWKSLSIAFLGISDQYASFFPQNGCRRPFWMAGWPKITLEYFSRHFRSIRNFFWILFSKWPPVAILEVRFG